MGMDDMYRQAESVRVSISQHTNTLHVKVSARQNETETNTLKQF